MHSTGSLKNSDTQSTCTNTGARCVWGHEGPAWQSLQPAAYLPLEAADATLEPIPSFNVHLDPCPCHTPAAPLPCTVCSTSTSTPTPRPACSTYCDDLAYAAFRMNSTTYQQMVGAGACESSCSMPLRGACHAPCVDTPPNVHWLHAAAWQAAP